jgi:DNA-binding transcriptional LysR family regulator
VGRPARFVVVARTLSFRKAATALRMSSSTVVRRMGHWKNVRLGCSTVSRRVLPYYEGRAVSVGAQQMERASHRCAPNLIKT